MNWFGWALASAGFAALTAIFGKVGVTGIQSDYATFLRTLVIIALIAAIVAAGGHWRPPSELPGRSLAFLALSALATGASWLCYYRAPQLGQAAQVAPIDKLSVVLVAVFAGGTVLVAWR